MSASTQALRPEAGIPIGPAMWVLTRRELVRFVRQPSRVVAALGTPLLFWVLLASGFAASFAPPGAEDSGGSYAAFLLPGIITMVVMFSSIFAAMSLIEDRRAGFLQSALVSPAPTVAIVGAKVAGGVALAAGQAALMLLAAPFVGLSPGVLGYAGAIVALVLIAAAVTGLGLAAAWKVDSSQGFHGVMNLVLLPMWLLSGAFFPAAGAAGWLAAIMLINPLRWSTDALRGSLTGEASVWAWLGAVAFAAAGVGAAMLMMRSRRG